MMFRAHPNLRPLFILVIAVCISCEPAERRAKPAAAGPQVRATVVTIRTTIQPENKSWTHTVVIAGDRVRSTGELDVWRLFDTRAKTVTFVDDVARTIRTDAFPALVQQRTTTNAGSLPAHYPRATVERTDERRTLHGVTAEKVTIRSGGYERVLWLAEHRAVPRDLFAMMVASERPSSPLAPMMRDVDRALLEARGFPLLDRTTVPVGDGTLVVERAVTGIAERDVAESTLAVPKGYVDQSDGAAAERLGKGTGRKD